MDHAATVTIVGVATAKPDTYAHLAQIMGSFPERALAEDGCISYYMMRDRDRERSIVFVERWSCQEAFDRHLSQGYIADFVAALPELLAEPLHMSFCNDVS